jgi:hypothetical protein
MTRMTISDAMWTVLSRSGKIKAQRSVPTLGVVAFVNHRDQVIFLVSPHCVLSLTQHLTSTVEGSLGYGWCRYRVYRSEEEFSNLRRL